MKAVIYAERGMMFSAKHLIKGGSDEENHYVGNGFGDDACIYWRMLAMVV